MVNRKISKNTKKPKREKARDFEAEILECVKSHVTGVTIQDIADEIKAARNTVSKYIYSLEFEKKVFKKKLGVYNLYFSSERKFVPKKMVVNYYKGLVYGLKQKFPNKEEVFKEIGHDVAKYWHLSLEYLPKFEGEINSIKDLTVKNFFTIFSEFYPYFDIFQKSLEVSDLEVNYNENKAKYRFHHSNLLEETDDFIYHYYVISGVIEKTISNALNKKILCNIEDIHISKDKEESYVDISIEIK